MLVDFNAEKNELLFMIRGITFNQVIEAIDENDGFFLILSIQIRINT